MNYVYENKGRVEAYYTTVRKEVTFIDQASGQSYGITVLWENEKVSAVAPRNEERLDN